MTNSTKPLRIIEFVEKVLKLSDRQLLELAEKHGIVVQDENKVFKRTEKWKFILARGMEEVQ